MTSGGHDNEGGGTASGKSGVERAFERLNAMVDGELSPAERAAVADEIAASRDMARAHATLARLKATVGALGENLDDNLDENLGGKLVNMALPLSEPRPSRRWPWMLAAAATAAAAVFAAVTWMHEPAETASTGPEQPTMVSLPALPPGVAVPRLDMAGLKLVSMTVEPPGHTVFASYRGPHGCRLDLRAAPAAAGLPALTGTARRHWVVGDIAYELVAHGMPPARFALIAGAAEWQTRQVLDPRRIEQPLRQAGLDPPPCMG
ncbi:MAG: hypothetical protein OJF62_001726 [Pseudolabrys sp.]|nr:hypothetical protein [Pseudolabrys sp.]